MEPKEFFNKPIIGKIVTREIEDFLLNGEKVKSPESELLEVIDIIKHDDGENLYVTNKWDNEALRNVFVVHENFILEKEIFNEQ